MASNTRTLAPYEIQALVDFFLYTMEGTQRRRLMNELPTVYNKIYEREIVKTVIIDD
jgi:hypothetical protein